MPRSSYVQTSLLPPEVIAATMRIGVVGATDHVQVQVEARDAGTGELMAMWAIPHAPYEALSTAVHRAADELVKIIQELAGPF